MTGREMLIRFEELLRNTNKDLEFDENISTEVIYSILTRAQEEYIIQNFLLGDSIKDNINAIRRRSDVLSKIIKRTVAGDITVAASATSKQIDGGYLATITNANYWVFLSGVLTHADLTSSQNDKGAPINSLELELINHYELNKKVRTLTNEPVIKKVPIVLEGANKFVFYLSKENIAEIDASIASTVFGIIYLARPTGIDGTNASELADSTHNDILKLAVEMFLREYKYKLGNLSKQQV